MLKKITYWCKLHHHSIFVFIGILIFTLPIILSRPLNNLDEIWNYNFARNTANGLIPYKDFNMVMTPLLPLIASVFLNIFGNELIVMRFLAILLISFIYFMIYKILKYLKVKTIFNLLFLFSLFLLLKDYICIDYNFAILFITLIIIYLELKNYDKNNNNLFYFFIGLICGSCILLKQSTGSIIAIASIIYPIFIIKNKLDFKIYLKTTFIKICGILIPIILLIIYLLLNNALYDFIDYAILGISTFNNSIPYVKLIKSENIVIKMLSILFPIFILITTIYIFIKRDKKLYIIYFYSLASFAVSYPIFDNIHFLIGITPFYVLFIYLLYKIFKWIISKLNKFNKLKYYLKHFSTAFVILLFIYYTFFVSIVGINNYLNNSDKNHLIQHYNYIPISNNLLNKINSINYYILTQNTPVYILDSEAAIYMISLNRYNKDFDMFNKGNLGSKGELGQIEHINNLPNGTKILIKKDNYSLNWQTPLKVINFVKDNLIKIDDISIFDIYEINK